MARGFLSGAVWGTVLSVGALGTISVVTGPGTGPRDMATESVPVIASDQVEADAPATEPTAEAEPAATAETEADAPDQAQTGADDATASAAETETTSEPARRPVELDSVTAESDTPLMQAPTPSEEIDPGAVVVAPRPAPDAEDTMAELDAPSVSGAPDVEITTPSGEAPGTATAPALTTPQSEIGLSVATEPAQPPAPAIPDVQSALAPERDAAGDEADPDPDADTGTDTAEAGSAAEGPQPERPRVNTLVPDTDDASEDVAAATPDAERPSIGRPAGSLIDRDTGSSRLPTIGTPTDDSAAQSDADADKDSRPALERYAVSVASDPNLPKMSIVLIDDGSGPLGPDALDSFPFPVTFALDPATDDAAERMARYRALGYEAALLVDIPAAAQPTDVEQILAGSIAALPETVALIEAPGSGLQSTRENTEQASRFASDSGHGLVFLPNGLNTAQAIAQRENVPAISILRDFDGDGQDTRTKRRFLDGAAFRARQDGAVVMLGRLTPDTVSALVLWSLQDRASSVAMVPVSRILMDPPE
ncbi:divergent polysaccharide deacetylase family protein [Marivita sp. S0852]|uniref:divergent polysaccharide deacetylase family protein n=1 Tax=Marivita sp. S0852 TaxID=3373893 RepID=UPI003982791B